MQPFGRNGYGPKMGDCAPLGEGELGPNKAQCGQRRGLPACQVSSSSIQPFGHNTPTSQTDRQGRQDRQTGQIDRTDNGRPKTNTQLQELLTCVCVSLFTKVIHNTTQNSSDNCPSYPPDTHHCSDDVYWSGGEKVSKYMAMIV